MLGIFHGTSIKSIAELVDVQSEVRFTFTDKYLHE